MKIANFPTPVYLTPPLKGFPWNFVSAQGSQETRVMELSDGRKSFRIGLAVLIQYRSVTASHPASHVAVAITLNANASSLKTDDIFRLACRRHSVYYLHPFSTLLCFVFCWDSYRAKTKPCFGDWRMCALCGCVFFLLNCPKIHH